MESCELLAVVGRDGALPFRRTGVEAMGLLGPVNLGERDCYALPAGKAGTGAAKEFWLLLFRFSLCLIFRAYVSKGYVSLLEQCCDGFVVYL